MQWLSNFLVLNDFKLSLFFLNFFLCYKDVPVIYVPGCSLFQENHNFPSSVMKIASKMKGGGGGALKFHPWIVTKKKDDSS